MIKNTNIDGIVDSVKYRIDFVDKNYRNKVANDIIDFIASTKLVHIKTDEKASNEFCQIQKLRSSNTTIASITTSTFCTMHDFQNINNYYIAVAFHGLVRYQKKLDAKSKLLLQHITAYLNTKKLPFIITQFDISTDI